MFFVRFIIGGLIIAFVPVVASKFSSRLAGYLILIPAIMYLSFLALYISSGHKTTLNTAQAYLIGLPAVAVSAGLIILMLRANINIYISIVVGIIGWLAAIFVINKLAF